MIVPVGVEHIFKAQNQEVKERDRYDYRCI
jgi:hypothetical protein